VCGVCHEKREGKPSGGVNTRGGEVIVCSHACFLKALEHGVTQAQMIDELSRKGPPS
jgi:hypothetical protein